MESRGKIHGAGDASHWIDHKYVFFPITYNTYNTKWETEAMCMSVNEEAIIKTTGRVDEPLECYGYTYALIYHA